MPARFCLSAAALVVLILSVTQSCGRSSPVPVAQTHSARKLKPVDGDIVMEAVRRGRTYVPAYSSIYWGAEAGGAAEDVVDLAVTMSVRNTSGSKPVIVESVRYYDSEGKVIREYVARPAVLPPMASAEFLVQRFDRTGGPGANFLVDWTVSAEADDPLLEAVMVGQHGSAGLSFTSPGKAVKR